MFLAITNCYVILMIELFNAPWYPVQLRFWIVAVETLTQCNR